MLNSKAIGAYISSLRKEQDLTQVQLADLVNVSHQAVSKWERGESLPDLDTLGALAKQFNITIDRLLYGGTANTNKVDSFVGHLVKNEPEEAAKLVDGENMDLDQLEDLAPLVKSSTFSRVAEGVKGATFTFSKLINLAPFLDRDTLEKLVQQIGGDEMRSWNDIVSIAPFISRQTVGQLLEGLEENIHVKDLVNIAPFLPREVDPLMKNLLLEELEWQDVVSLAPFINRSSLAKLIRQFNPETIETSTLIQLAPFLEREIITHLLETVELKNLEAHQIEKLAPFIGSGNLGMLIEKLGQGDRFTVPPQD